MASRMKNPDHRDAITLYARMGYASRGIVYVLVGGLAALAAFGQGGQTEGSRGALERVLTAPFGNVLLGSLPLACWATLCGELSKQLKTPTITATAPKV